MAMHPTLGMLAGTSNFATKTAHGLTYWIVSGVALPFCRGPSEPTSASPLAPLGLMMNVDGGGAVGDGIDIPLNEA
jgi:hypothetical protein